MFSVIFPGQGSQSVGMTKDFYENFNFVRELFNKADDILSFKISKHILEGPQEVLNNTEITQPAIFLSSFCIYETLKRENLINFSKAKYFAGHSLGEYSALAACSAISFDSTIRLLKLRGQAMQSAVPEGIGGMVAVLGSEIKIIEEILNENKNNYECFVANDNSNGQLVISGKNKDLELFIKDLKNKSIKNVKLPVSAPFHCKLMEKATNAMTDEIKNTTVKKPENLIISNVTSDEVSDPIEIKNLLIKQIESPVRWRESINNMILKGVKKYVEIGPGKVLSGLIKRIDRSVSIVSVNNLEDLKNINLND